MPTFDPTLPKPNSKIRSIELRNQYNSLKDLVDAILTITAAQVDGVNTVNPGEPASVTVSVVGNTLHLTFNIPRGDKGDQGDPGDVTRDGSGNLRGPFAHSDGTAGIDYDYTDADGNIFRFRQGILYRVDPP